MAGGARWSHREKFQQQPTAAKSHPPAPGSSQSQQEFLNSCVIPTTCMHPLTPFKYGVCVCVHANRREGGGGQEAKPACKQKSVFLSNHSRKIFRGNTKLFLGYKAPTHNNKQGPHLTKLYKEPAVVKDANVLPRQAWAETTVKTHQLHSY